MESTGNNDSTTAQPSLSQAYLPKLSLDPYCDHCKGFIHFEGGGFLSNAFNSTYGEVISGWPSLNSLREPNN